jgi:hypothetical protein
MVVDMVVVMVIVMVVVVIVVIVIDVDQGIPFNNQIEMAQPTAGRA